VTHTLAYIAAGLLVLYVGLLATLWRFQEQIVFQPPRNVAASEIPARRVSYRADDGVELFAYVVGDCLPSRPVILAFHGNADLARWLVPWAARAAREADACVVIAEYRGYDAVPGEPSYVGSKHDARAALAYTRDVLGASPGQLVYYGHSLGSAIAAELAAADPPRALILESPFSSARAMSRRLLVPFVTAFWALISRVHFDTVARARELDAPIWVAHGENDLVVPVAMGREVFAAACRPGEILIVPGAGHNDVAEIAGDDYWRWLVRAIHSGDSLAVSRDAPARRRSAP
jgi:uncharacterized protein